MLSADRIGAIFRNRTICLAHILYGASQQDRGSEREIPMGITEANKEVSVSQIGCGEEFQIRLSLTAEPNIVANPVDIVLILDRSGSMTGDALESLKEGAKTFIQIIDQSTDGSQDGQIGNGSRIGIVSFSDVATQDTQLITSVAVLNGAVDALTAGGNTNHADAFSKAVQLFDAASTNEKVMVMFTDGVTTTGGNAGPIAAAARAQGIIIYAIGLDGSGGVDINALNDWATDPDVDHVAVTPDDAELEELFGDLAQTISSPGATNIVITDTVSPCFRIVGVAAPDRGTAMLVDPITVQWQIAVLGASQTETAVLEFTLQNLGSCSGTVEVNEAISYDDADGNTVLFPSPEITIDCEPVVVEEECPEPVDVELTGCSDAVEVDAGELELGGTGSILELDVTLRHVCPNRRVALAVLLTEMDEVGEEHRRGLKTMVIPAHDEEGCRDVVVRCIKFILPEALDVSGENDGGCNLRNCRARLFAHYIDTDFACCGNLQV